jgi:hypothetical protein
MTMFRNLVAVGALSIGLAVVPASAATVLTFEGVGNNVAVNNFYNGGAGGNLGISFVNGFGLVDSDAGGTGNFANEPSASTVLYFTSGTASTMNVAAGFNTGFSFFYSSSAPASVNVYSGLNGTGTLLATLALAAQYADNNCHGDPTGTYCNWSPIGVTFAGTAQSVSFGGSANFVAFDNITLGAASPTGAVPEPATWGLMVLGFGMIGAASRSRKVKTTVRFA